MKLPVGSNLLLTHMANPVPGSGFFNSLSYIDITGAEVLISVRPLAPLCFANRLLGIIK